MSSPVLPTASLSRLTSLARISPESRPVSLDSCEPAAGGEKRISVAGLTVSVPAEAVVSASLEKFEVLRESVLREGPVGGMEKPAAGGSSFVPLQSTLAVGLTRGSAAAYTVSSADSSIVAPTATAAVFRRRSGAGARVESVVASPIRPLRDVNEIIIKGLEERAYISSFPSEKDVYWKFIAGQKVSIGVQLESGIHYPSYHLEPGKEQKFEAFKVNLVDIKVMPFCKKRVYSISSADNPTLSFTHYEFSWPDFGTPKEREFISFMTEYTEMVRSLKDPVVHIHCAGGKGRSGTFLFTRALLVQPQLTVRVAQALLTSMRSSRPGLVETTGQEKFAYDYALSQKASLPSSILPSVTSSIPLSSVPLSSALGLPVAASSSVVLSFALGLPVVRSDAGAGTGASKSDETIPLPPVALAGPSSVMPASQLPSNYRVSSSQDARDPEHPTAQVEQNLLQRLFGCC